MNKSYKPITKTKEIQKIEFNILKYIDKFCRENQIKYFLVGGTLIGAIRHKGFIPWDDDIDIGMLRKDYERFIELFPNNSANIKLLTRKTMKDYYYSYAKVIDNRTVLKEHYRNVPNLGVFVDVFPFDYIEPENIKKLQKKTNTIISRMILAGHAKVKYKHNLLKKLVSILLCPLGLIPISVTSIIKDKEIKRLASTKKCKNVINFCGAYGRKEITKTEFLSDTVDVNFEDGIFMAPRNYDSYLRGIYGNYMELPPIEKRQSNHDFEMFWKEAASPAK